MTRSTHLDPHRGTGSGTGFGKGPIVIHVQFAGQRFSIPLTSLDIGTATADAKVKRAVATRLLVTPDRLDDHVVHRHPDGNLTLRPQPVRPRPVRPRPVRPPPVRRIDVPTGLPEEADEFEPAGACLNGTRFH